MSLDVTLYGKSEIVECLCGECFDSHMRIKKEVLFESNITHNLVDMARAAGIYNHCWVPEELAITKARSLIEPLQKGLDLLKSDPKKFERYNSPNGWGLYENFVSWVEEYLKACKKYPEGSIETSR